MPSQQFERFAGVTALLAGVAELLYAIAFIILHQALFAALCLTVFGALAIGVWLGMYLRVCETDRDFAMLALIFGLVGAIGGSIHGGYDLANAINPPTLGLPQAAELPSHIDPRGIATFGFGGIGLAIAAWLITRTRTFPKSLGYVGCLSALLLVVLYLGRLIILDPASFVILVPALLNGFLVGPAFYIWLGYALWNSTQRRQNARSPCPTCRVTARKITVERQPGHPVGDSTLRRGLKFVSRAAVVSRSLIEVPSAAYSSKTCPADMRDQSDRPRTSICTSFVSLI